MHIPFAAYADDCTVTGELALDTDRLSDFLAETEELAVSAAAFRALEDGHVVNAGSASILRGDLCVVEATGPRGLVERRVWTRQFPVRARVGPYTVVGYLHAPPTIDPFGPVDRRTIVPLTTSVVEYEVGGLLRRDHARTVLLNGRKIDRLEQIEKDELEPPGDVDPPNAGEPAEDELIG